VSEPARRTRGGHFGPDRRHVAFDLFGRDAPEDHGCNGRRAEGEPEGSDRDRDAMGLADALDPRDLVHHFGRGRPVVEMSARLGPGRQDAGIVDAPEDDADPLPFGERQELVQGVLLEERVAPGEQHAVEVSRLHEAHRRVGFVESEAHGLDDALAPELVRGFVGSLHRLPEALVRHLGPVRPDVHIVQEEDVDAVEAEPQEGLLEGAHRAVIGIVHDGGMRHAPGEARASDAAARHAGVHAPSDLR